MLDNKQLDLLANELVNLSLPILHIIQTATKTALVSATELDITKLKTEPKTLFRYIHMCLVCYQTDFLPAFERRVLASDDLFTEKQKKNVQSSIRTEKNTIQEVAKSLAAIEIKVQEDWENNEEQTSRR